MAMRDKAWWAATIAEVAGNLDALARRAPYAHLVRNASGTGSVRPLTYHFFEFPRSRSYRS
jgi:hypothetical protein